ncbi:MAG: prolipoprotein diacylglyceryl transferase [Dissulfurimicrobium sp.]|uniref:prolipoprotein diacylglyceryl transferase n=1 Tax=Dissulfurimicrobium TaxID=1769732 RepID=UPI001EDAD3D1|nr:prolipoprotein diacylglyceryl transferase [Dissulfurimicrobium hydrothermale]UKL13603.1 prolipoprotein diacylglyceryl transferase [Dissulfurimicrobium hydrothermale]
MLPYPQIDPVILEAGPFALRWYGLMYLIGFLASYSLVRRQITRHAVTSGVGGGDQSLDLDMEAELNHLDGLFLWLAIGVIVGGRLGYVLFYNLPYYLNHPFEILATWHGGMSFHGGAAGAMAAGWAYCIRHRINFWLWADRFAVTAPIGLGFGRIGNFINGELYGRPTNVPWAMIFPQGGPIPRHPSQLYEAFLEGILLFIILWPLSKRPWPHGRKLALFLMLYAIVRSVAELFREPDPQLGFVLLGSLTMGQILSIGFFVLGLFLWWYLGRPLTSKSS